MADRRLVSSGAVWEPLVGYSRAVRVGQHVWVAGTTGHCPDAAAQAREALHKIEAALAEAVRTRIFVTDITQWEAVGREHGRVFADIRPASTMVQVAALIEPELLVEIEADAYISDREPTREEA